MTQINHLLQRTFLLILFICSALQVSGQANSYTLNLPDQGDKTVLNRQWIARQATHITVDGTQLSAGRQDFKGWIPATVPGTVLSTLLDNELIPSPYFGMNNEIIPDIYHTGNEFYTYWFVNRFTLPAVTEGQRLWLNFRGINYKAEIFLNGKRISTSTHEGMFIRRGYDITEAVKAGGVNTLAVLVFPPDYPGEANGGQAGDGQIAKNNTMHYTAGWDWIQPVRDRNTGIWDEVSLTVTGNVRMMHPQIITQVPGTRMPEGVQADASLRVNTEVENLTSHPQVVSITYTVEDQKQTTKVQLAPREKKEVSLPVMKVKNPRLWWPNLMGKQELYTMNITVTDASSKLLDKQSVRFGIRELSTVKDEKTGGRMFFVNGQKLFIRGGNYIASDWMMRLSAERYRTEVRFLADMNMNMIRVWGGAIPERPEFYNACDEYGLLVYQDLSVTGDANGAWPDAKKKDSQPRRWAYPDNHALFLESVVDQIKMLRNHPSLCLWCGGNEWPAATDILDALQNEIMPKYDTRDFAAFSTDTLFTRNTIGGVGDGPYGIQEPEWFYNFRSTPFNPELGSVGVPEATALRAIMNESDYNNFPKGRQINPTWAYHKYIPYEDHINRYAEPTTTEEFCNIAQLLNYEQYRALMEGWASQMWNWYTGMLIWKIQNPWTALRGQMYDCYLDVNACYYGVRVGGQPLHVQYNYVNGKVEVVNTTLLDKKSYTVRARVYQLDGKLLNEQKEANVLLKANVSRPLFEVFKPTQVQGVYFLRLELLDGTKVIDDNSYWLTTLSKDYTQLQHMPKSGASITVTTNRKDSGYEATVTVKTKDQISFFNRISVFNKKTGERILPVYYSDNYITVFPQEEKTVTLTFDSALPAEEIDIRVNGWN